MVSKYYLFEIKASSSYPRKIDIQLRSLKTVVSKGKSNEVKEGEKEEFDPLEHLIPLETQLSLLGLTYNDISHGSIDLKVKAFEVHEENAEIRDGIVFEDKVTGKKRFILVCYRREGGSLKISSVKELDSTEDLIDALNSD